MSSRSLFMIAALFGASTFAAALFVQYVDGLPPCELCMWQRYALSVGIAGASIAALLPGFTAQAFGAIGAAGYAAESGVAMFHSGVERGWWEGLASCSGGSLPTTFEPNAMIAEVAKGPVPSCGDIVWSVLGLSMANWNVLIAAALALICVIALIRGRSANYASSSVSQ